MVIHISRMGGGGGGGGGGGVGHVEHSTGTSQAGLLRCTKLIVVARKRLGRSMNTWVEVLVDDRKKLGMDSADPQNRSEWRGKLRGRLVNQDQPSVEENKL